MINIIKKSSFCFIVLILIYIVLLTITSCIPKKNVQKNIEESVKYFYDSEVDQVLYISGFTDAVMLDINYRLDHTMPLESILKAKMIASKDKGIEPILRI